MRQHDEPVSIVTPNLFRGLAETLIAHTPPTAAGDKYDELISQVKPYCFNIFVKMKKGYVYILSNFKRNVFYIGVTSDLELRITKHRNGTGSAFTSKYKTYYLIYFEEFQSIQLAIAREKQLKRWHRDWKINLIKSQNPELKDLMER